MVEIKPPAMELFYNALAPTTLVKPAPVKGVWLPSSPPNITSELEKAKVILHFPGGAFVIAFGHETSGRPATEILTKYLQANRVLWAQYRLASNNQTCFPAALQDALTYYHHLLSLGINSKNIVLSGDSAGGNIVLALMRYPESAQASELPLPGSAIVFSPWVHVTSHAAKDYEACSNIKADILSGSLLQWGAASYLPSEQLSRETEAYISPLHHPFRTSAGEAESFFEHIKSFSAGMKEMNGDRVRFHAAPKAPHDFLLYYDAFGMKDELVTAVDKACEFFDERK
ncbi:alpha/beta-hydrolase [Cryphonectria parasitica EP155]|uniref:Alpha/beta-hydrolase n=1 Tax=Cryphonectria parasitica (strain ATCC 38755 / EP155) TaxID=660469 RepID=A0A9P4XWC0_CRYP1|nr:alpha/beta-hydrolase [Cryphonectria parasitica EP155]KAF3762106.1 alpha/beta-hydrolase [Cryphonectria parasitica EP155]